ncbi:restriction endonuclease subunit S [Virgibacillus sediminis]|uniref:Restriction endonuclease subunit S n=1 Tax=Virgibacillus sediminis TaxID=202260 RepID=A0ABV7A3K2_9BACI
MENKQTPEIRFPGFTGKWEQHKLGEISEKVTEKNKDNNYSETLTNSAEFGIITQRDFFEKDISNKKNLNGYYIVHPDYFVYNPRISNFAPVGPIKRNKLGRTGVMSPLYYVFHTHDVDKTYLEYYFSGNNWHRFMKLNGDSGARSDRFAIKDSVFREMPIPIPSGEEQTKIGNLFKQLDDSIAIHEQELTTLQQTKQGFLQKMFPKEGESVPEVRFPGFTGDWKKLKLRDLLKSAYQGINTAGDKVEYSDNGVKVLQSKHITSGTISFDDARYLDKERYSEYFPKYVPDIDDILFANIGTIGPSAVVTDSREFLIAWNILKITPINEANSKFIQLQLQRLNSQRYFEKVTTGNATKFVNKDEILGTRIVVPEKKEQSKIGDFFANLDHLVTLHQRELDALKDTKKAFLQKMFV